MLDVSASEEKPESNRKVFLLSGSSFTTSFLFQGFYGPLNADGREESYPDEISGYRGEGPEEVLSCVGLLQGEVLVRLQAGRHLCLWVGVTLM